MNFWWKLGIFLTLLALNDVAVWRVHTWRDGFKDTSAILAEQEATRRAMKASSDIDTSFEASITNLHRLELSANQNLEAIHETSPAYGNCRLNPQRLSILQRAIAARPDSR